MTNARPRPIADRRIRRCASRCRRFPNSIRTALASNRSSSRVPRYQAQTYRAAGKLQGKAALITGGDSGIGRAVALLYAREGAKVAIACLPEERSDAEETHRAVEAAGGQCWIMPGDLTDAQYCGELVENTVRELGALDILVSNAAHQSRKDKLEDVTDDEIERTFDTNVYAYMRLARSALKHMKPGACIIATSSETGIMGSQKLPDYSATQRRDQCLHQGAGAVFDFARDPRQCGCAGAGVDAAESVRPGFAGRGCRGFRKEESHGTSRATGRARAGVRVPCVERGFFVHHGNGTAGHGRRDDRRLAGIFHEGLAMIASSPAVQTVPSSVSRNSLCITAFASFGGVFMEYPD